MLVKKHKQKSAYGYCFWFIVLPLTFTITQANELPDIIQNIHKPQNKSAIYSHSSEKGMFACADPGGGLVAEKLVFIDAAEATLLGGVPGAKLKK